MTASADLFHPAFPLDWPKASLWSLAEWINGLAFREIHFTSSGKPVVKIAELKDGIGPQTRFTSGIYSPLVAIERGDLLFSWSGQPESSIDAFWWRGGSSWLNQHIFRVRPRPSIEPTFFFYVLKYLKPNFVGIARNKQTTGLGHVTKTDMQRISVGVPARAEQRVIAEALGSLDAKIDVNWRMGETLEEIARVLFQSWFVDFDPVRGTATMPEDIRRLFPDRLVDSSIGPIPAGWDVAPLSKLMTVSRESVDPRDHPDELFDHYSLPAFDAGRVPANERGADIKSSKLRVADGCVLLSKLNPRIPRVWWPSSPGPLRRIASTEFVVTLPQDHMTRTYLFGLFMSAGFRSTLTSLVRGTSGSHQRVSVTDLLEIDVPIPPRPLVDRFDAIVGPMFDQQEAHQAESKTLAELRDTLLPKLVSGELRLRDAS